MTFTMFKVTQHKNSPLCVMYSVFVYTLYMTLSCLTGKSTTSSTTKQHSFKVLWTLDVVLQIKMFISCSLETPSVCEPWDKISQFLVTSNFYFYDINIIWCT